MVPDMELGMNKDLGSGLPVDCGLDMVIDMDLNMGIGTQRPCMDIDLDLYSSLDIHGP